MAARNDVAKQFYNVNFCRFLSKISQPNKILCIFQHTRTTEFRLCAYIYVLMEYLHYTYACCGIEVNIVHVYKSYMRIYKNFIYNCIRSIECHESFSKIEVCGEMPRIERLLVYICVRRCLLYNHMFYISI